MSKLRQILFAQQASQTGVAATPDSNQTANTVAGAKVGGSSLALWSRAGSSTDSASESTYQELKSRIHAQLVENLDINALMQIEGTEALEAAVQNTVHHLLSVERLPLSPDERLALAQDVLNETLGLGPLEPLLSDPEVNDVLVNGAHSIWVDRDGKLNLSAARFKDDRHLLHIINRVASRVGRRVDESSPIVDARLPDGSRVNAIIPPLSLDGPILSVRRFRPTPFNLEDLVNRGTLNNSMAAFLIAAVQARLNILVSGGTSAGKTTLLNVLSGYISHKERIITIEDTAELRLQQRHVVRLESRPANVEGQGMVGQRELVKNALRMRPDRIVVGEVRGPEALDMLQAMNTGHEGSLTTLHANSPRDALSRLETLVLMAGLELSQRSIREQIASAFDLIVQVKRLADGTRKVVSVSELVGLQTDVISMQELFFFDQTGLNSDGKVTGRHRSQNLIPACQSRFVEAGIELDRSWFDSGNPEDIA